MKTCFAPPSPETSGPRYSRIRAWHCDEPTASRDTDYLHTFERVMTRAFTLAFAVAEKRGRI